MVRGEYPWIPMRSIKTCDGVFENILTTFKLQNCIHSRFNHTPCCLHFHVHTHSLFMSLSYSMHALIHLHILSYLCQKNRSLAFDTPTSNPRATENFSATSPATLVAIVMIWGAHTIIAASSMRSTGTSHKANWNQMQKISATFTFFLSWKSWWKYPPGK